MNEKHLKLINKIVDLPSVSDLSGFTLDVKMIYNGKQEYEVVYRCHNPHFEEEIKLSTDTSTECLGEEDAGKRLEIVLTSLQEMLKEKSQHKI